MSKIDTNIMFLQQDIIDFDSCFWIEKYIQGRYKTVVFMLNYTLNGRINLAKLHNKKFGLVLKTIKP